MSRDLHLFAGVKDEFGKAIPMHCPEVAAVLAMLENVGQLEDEADGQEVQEGSTWFASHEGKSVMLRGGTTEENEKSDRSEVVTPDSDLSSVGWTHEDLFSLGEGELSIPSPGESGKPSSIQPDSSVQESEGSPRKYNAGAEEGRGGQFAPKLASLGSGIPPSWALASRGPVGTQRGKGHAKAGSRPQPASSAGGFKEVSTDSEKSPDLEQHVSYVKALYDGLPKSLREKFATDGISVCASETIKSVDPSKDEDGVDGTFRNGKIIVPRTKLRSFDQTREPHSKEKLEEVFYHECGHGLDSVGGSNYATFSESLEADWKSQKGKLSEALKRRGLNEFAEGYFLTHVNETYAEMAGMLLSGKGGDRLDAYRETFPEIHSDITKRLKKTPPPSSSREGSAAGADVQESKKPPQKYKAGAEHEGKRVGGKFKPNEVGFGVVGTGSGEPEAWRISAGDDLAKQVPDKEDSKESSDQKLRAIQILGKRLEQAISESPEEIALVKKCGEKYFKTQKEYNRYGEETEVKTNCEAFVACCQGAWSRSSTSELSRVMQARARVLFGSDDSRPKIGTRPWSEIPKSSGAEAWNKRQEELAKYAPVVDRYLKLVYEATQEVLRNRGIKSVKLFRGMTVETDTEHDLRKDLVWVRNLGERDHGKPVSDHQNVVTNPMSSYTTDLQEAIRFAESGCTGLLADRKNRAVVIIQDIPAEKVLAMYVTGLGCREESEFIVLGGKSKAQTITYAAAPYYDGHRVTPAMDEGTIVSLIESLDVDTSEVLDLDATDYLADWLIHLREFPEKNVQEVQEAKPPKRYQKGSEKGGQFAPNLAGLYGTVDVGAGIPTSWQTEPPPVATPQDTKRYPKEAEVKGRPVGGQFAPKSVQDAAKETVLRRAIEKLLGGPEQYTRVTTDAYKSFTDEQIELNRSIGKREAIARHLFERVAPTITDPTKRRHLLHVILGSLNRAGRDAGKIKAASVKPTT